MYLREADVTAALDAWLLSVFDPENLDGAVAALAAAQVPDEAGAARAEAARRKCWRTATLGWRPTGQRLRRVPILP